MASSEIVWAQAWSEPNAGSDLAAIRSTGVLSDDGTEWVLNGQKIWASRAVWADWCFGIFRTDPEAERHRGLTFVLVPLDSPGVTVRPIAQLDGDTGFAEIFFDDVRVPVENTLGEVNQGWRVAMATAGFERGVSLRSPARFSAAADRLVALWREHADPSDTALRDAVADAWMQAEGYKLHTYMTVTHMIEGGTIGAEASLNKIFWSEMDVRIHELALDIARPRGRAHGRTVRALGRRLPVLAVGPDLRGHQRDPAQHHRRPRAPAPAGCLMRFAFTDDQKLFAEGLRDLLAKECTPAHVRAAWDDGAGHDFTLWNHLAEMGVFGMLVPEAAGGLGGTEVDLVLLLEELGRAAVPGPVLETAAVVAPALGDARRPSAPPRSTVRRTSRTRTSPSVVLVPGGVVRTDGATLTAVDAHRRRPPALHRRRCAVEPFDVRRGRSRSTAARWPRPRTWSGLSERMIDVAAEYARQREQYGRPIGVNQAVKHLLADALLKVEFAKPAVYRAAWSVAERRADARAATSRWRRRSPATPPTARAAARCRCTARSGTRGKPTCSSG